VEDTGLSVFEEIMMHRLYFLIVTALAEAGTGLLLLIVPSIPVALLLGVKEVSAEVAICARIAGAALLSIGVACWFGRFDKGSGLLTSVLIYDVAAAAILAYSGLFVSLVGIALWPAVLLHAVLAVWCIGCMSKLVREAEKLR
jgi:hypothetical protein